MTSTRRTVYVSPGKVTIDWTAWLLVSLVAVVLTASGCDHSNIGPVTNAALIVFDSATGHVNVRNMTDSNLTDCALGVANVERPFIDPRCHCLTHDEEITNIIAAFNQTEIAVLHPGESIDVPLSTFSAYQDKSLFLSKAWPYAYISCAERARWTLSTRWTLSHADLVPQTRPESSQF